MTRRTVAVISLYYLFLPLAIFLCSWVKLWIGIPLTLLLGIAPLFMLKSVRGETVTGSLRQDTGVFFVLLLWVVLSGIGRYVWQNRWDHFFAMPSSWIWWNVPGPFSQAGTLWSIT